MNKFCILVCLVLTFSAATLVTSAKLEDLSQLKESKFGKNIMQSIQLEFSANANPIGKIIDLLQQIKSQLNQDQEDADAQYASDTAQLNQDISNTEDNIATTQQTINDAKNDKALNQALLNDNQDTLSSKNAALVQQQAILDAEIQQRNAEHTEYMSQKDELNNYISGLVEGKQIISQLLSSSATLFLENKQLKSGDKSPIITQFADKVKTVKGYYRGLNTLIQMFGQIMQTPGIQADQELVQNLINILEGLIDKLNNDLTTLQENEATQVELFNQKSESLNTIIDGLNNDIGQLTADIAQEIAQIAQDQATIDDNQDILDIQQQQLLDYQQELQTTTNNYNHQTLQRNDEIKIVDEVIDIFASFDKDKIADYVSNYSFDY